MKSIKLTVVGAAAAALILGAGCRSDSRTDMQRHEALGVQHETVPATGGSGMDSNVNPVPSPATAPIEDHGLSGQEANLQKDSNLNDSSLQKRSTLSTRSTSGSVSSKKRLPMEKRSSESMSEGQDVRTGNTNDLGMGGTGDMAPAPLPPADTAPVMVPDTAPVTQPAPMDSSTSSMSSYTGTQDTIPVTPYQKHPRLNGSLDNETGSRTNITGSNISTNTNPTEPRGNAKDQVPRR
jgi:hypothetical protein